MAKARIGAGKVSGETIALDRNPSEKIAAMTYRTISVSKIPVSGAVLAIGNDLKRSKTPVSISSRSCVPAPDVALIIWNTKIPGTIVGR